MEKDFSKLIGIPYSELDCWGIVREWYKIVYGIELKHYYQEIPKNRDIANNLIYSSMGDFKKVDSPIYGDIILIKLFGVESHIAVYLGNGKILHTSHNTGCIIDNLSKWQKVVTGYFRVVNNDKIKT